MKKKGLEVNTEKPKIIRFGKRIMMKEKRDRKWEEREINDVNKYRYLAFTFQRNGKVEAHVRERARKARRAMREVWGIEKR